MSIQQSTVVIYLVCNIQVISGHVTMLRDVIGRVCDITERRSQRALMSLDLCRENQFTLMEELEAARCNADVEPTARYEESLRK